MKYLAIPLSTTDWLLAHGNVRDELLQLLASPVRVATLAKGVLASGPLRIAATPDESAVVIWNVDYLSGTDEEAWGFIRATQYMGLMNRDEMQDEVFERCLAVINRRLQGLRLDTALIHRSYPNAAHTCIAGRGKARELSIGYFERPVDVKGARGQTLICVGPHRDREILADWAFKESASLPTLIHKAVGIIQIHRSRPTVETASFASLRGSAGAKKVGVVPSVTGPELKMAIPEEAAYKTLGWTYDDWLKNPGTLSEAQNRILDSDAVAGHPVRILGPAGSGKTLTMQLLALKLLREAEKKNQNLRVLYVAHNSAMVSKVTQKFETLGDQRFLSSGAHQRLSVLTLAQYAIQELQLKEETIIDPDAEQTKNFQLAQVASCMREVLSENADLVKESMLLSLIVKRDDLFAALALLVSWEISNVIKGRGLTDDEQRYVAAEHSYSRLHGGLSQEEREVVFKTFQKYHEQVFEQGKVLDTDDISISLLGRLRTPIWKLKRKEIGFDFVFVDEAQLFNENERKIFPLLTRGLSDHVPVALAMDLAQEPFGQTTAGFAKLGLPAMTDERLPTIYRSTPAIVRLAFFIIQKTTDLFGADFPDFTKDSNSVVIEDKQASPPRFERWSGDAKSISKFVAARVQALRAKNVRQIAVICHADRMWDDIKNNLANDLGPASGELVLLDRRGIPLDDNQPKTVLAKPAYVGGQEFDAVLAVGLEQGLVPPRVVDNEALASALEQAALREMYLSFTRARLRLEIILTRGGAPTAILAEAVNSKLIPPPPKKG